MNPRAKEISKRHPRVEHMLLKQPDIALGLGIFEALHLNKDGIDFKNKRIVDAIDDVL